MTDDDATLLRLYAENRSEAAFTALVQRHLDLVYSAALRRLNGDSHHASDVAQSVFLSLARHAGTLARRPVLVGWLYTTTRHAAIDVIRAEQRRRTREQHAHVMDSANTSNASSPDWETLRPLLDDAVDQLGEREREIVLLRFFENRSFADVGAKFSLSEDAARMRAARALEKLRSLLARRGITSTAAALGTMLAAQTVVAAPAGLAACVSSGAVAVIATTSTATFATTSFALMTTSKTLLVGASLAIIAATGVAVHQARLTQRTVIALAETARERDALRAQSADLNSRLTASATELARLTVQQKEMAAKFTQSTVTPKVPTPNPNGREWTIPGYGRAVVEMDRATLRLRYAQLYRDLHLTPDQIALFEKAKTEHQQGLVDVNMEASAQGLSPNDTAVLRLQGETFEVLNKSLRDLLGDSGFAEYQQYQKNAKVRDLVSSLAGGIYFSDSPLTASQGTELTRVLKASTQTKMIPMKDEGSKTVYAGFEEIDWANVTAASQTFLLAPQLAVLTQLAEKQRAETEMMRLSMEQKGR